MARKALSLPQSAEAPATILQDVFDKFDLGPAMNKRIQVALKIGMDPLDHLPTFFTKGQVKKITAPDGTVTINMGNLHGFECKFFHYVGRVRSDPQRASLFMLGCQKKYSREAALAHWIGPNGTSVSSKRERPNVPALVEWLTWLCRYNGWKW